MTRAPGATTALADDADAVRQFVGSHLELSPLSAPEAMKRVRRKEPV